MQLLDLAAFLLTVRRSAGQKWFCLLCIPPSINKQSRSATTVSLHLATPIVDMSSIVVPDLAALTPFAWPARMWHVVLPLDPFALHTYIYLLSKAQVP